MDLSLRWLDDEKIILKIQSGEFRLFAILVERYEERIKRYARKFLSNHQDIEDVVQEVFLKAYRNIQSFDSTKKFSSWLYRVAHNELVNALKKHNKRPLLFFDPDTLFPHTISQENPENELDKKELLEILDQSLDKLDPKYREPLILYYFEELSYKEIADILHIPINTVGVRLKRGKKIIQAFYQKLNYHL